MASASKRCRGVLFSLLARPGSGRALTTLFDRIRLTLFLRQTRMQRVGGESGEGEQEAPHPVSLASCLVVPLADKRSSVVGADWIAHVCAQPCRQLLSCFLRQTLGQLVGEATNALPRLAQEPEDYITRTVREEKPSEEALIRRHFPGGSGDMMWEMYFAKNDFFGPTCDAEEDSGFLADELVVTEEEIDEEIQIWREERDDEDDVEDTPDRESFRRQVLDERARYRAAEHHAKKRKLVQARNNALEKARQNRRAVLQANKRKLEEKQNWHDIMFAGGPDFPTVWEPREALDVCGSRRLSLRIPKNVLCDDGAKEASEKVPVGKGLVPSAATSESPPPSELPEGASDAPSDLGSSSMTASTSARTTWGSTVLEREDHFVLPARVFYRGLYEGEIKLKVLVLPDDPARAFRFSTYLFKPGYIRKDSDHQFPSLAWLDAEEQRAGLDLSAWTNKDARGVGSSLCMAQFSEDINYETNGFWVDTESKAQSRDRCILTGVGVEWGQRHKFF